MAVGANSYGTAADVAALTDLYTISSAYTTATIPTLAQVEGWIDQISGVMNTALAAQGFTIPVTQADAVLAIKSFVVEAVVDLSHAANSAGRYFTPQALERGITPMASIRKQILDWVAMFAEGLENIGAARTGETGSGEVLYRDIDTAGDEITPIFQRKAHGNVFQNWDE
jgi:hypothetical protein